MGTINYALTAAASLVIVSTSLAQTTTIGASPYKNVGIAPVSDNPTATAVLGGTAAKLVPSCFLLSNKDSRAIVGALVTWVTKTSAGNQQMHRHSTDSFQGTTSPPILAPGARMLVAPGIWVPEEQIASLSGSPRLLNLQQLVGIFSLATTVDVHLDSVIFSDGEIVGPDTQHFETELTERKQAATAVVRAVVTARESGMSPLDALAKMRAQNRGAGAPSLTTSSLAVWTRRFADGLLHEQGNSFDHAVADLAQMPEVVLHRIK